MKIVVSGASGFIGRRLLQSLAAEGHQLHVLSRRAGANVPAGVGVSVWDPLQGEPPAESLRGQDAVIHLAGENVAQRWTAGANGAFSRAACWGPEAWPPRYRGFRKDRQR